MNPQAWTIQRVKRSDFSRILDLKNWQQSVWQSPIVRLDFFGGEAVADRRYPK